ncbi:MAG: hypothetical protein DMG49_17090 [Acidobacteria bacterium]|nr:MAG: hypothetical protein DMG49_17090 [Acidobacteriota bacterium]
MGQKMLAVRMATVAVLVSAAPLNARSSQLPAQYFRLLEAGIVRVGERMDAEPGASLKTLAARPGWNHFPQSILAAAVLYAKQHPANAHYRDPKMLALAIRIGDLLASECEKRRSETCFEDEWDPYMWLEAYRLLVADLGDERRAKWKRYIEHDTAPLASDARKRQEFPWYNTPYIGTSPNHFASWAALIFLSGRVFGNKEWEDLGRRILHRFAAEEQTPDGYWGEHSRSGPTTGYDHITFTQVAVYWEYSRDPVALQALRRGTDFHIHFTYPDGTPVETINDRNRYWKVNSWGHFGFSNFADGRRYAEFLTDFFRADNLRMDDLGRLAQDALYYHEGPTEPMPQEQPRYSYQMSVPAGIRKAGPWVVCLSGLISTPAVNSQFYLDRQGHLSVFHNRLGLVITGAGSKRQPELATFFEKMQGQTFHVPISSRLQMNDNNGDRLSLAYNTFFTDLNVPPPSEQQLQLRFVMTARGQPPSEAQLNLQLCLKAGETLETGAGLKIVLGTERVELGPAEVGGWIRHHGWKLQADSTARLTWPVYPHDPYKDAPETKLEHAVGVVSVPLQLGEKDAPYIRPNAQEISFTLMVD